MLKKLRNAAYIDNTNLYKGCQSEGFNIDYKKFRVYLKERHGVEHAFMFIGYVADKEPLYKKFKEWGYIIIYKTVIIFENGKIKGNCDAELVLETVCGYYEKKYEKAILVTSDGDFACLVHFLLNKEALEIVLSPRNKDKCSSLLRKSDAKLTFLPEIRNSIS